MMRAIWVFLFCFPVFAEVYPYLIKGSNELPVCDESYLELKNLPPVRDQRNYGLCYAHSTMLLLDYLRCSKSINPNCLGDKGSVLHLARMEHSYSEDKIDIGGDPVVILARFKAGLRLARESCAEYEDWVKLGEKYKKEINALGFSRDEDSEVDFFYMVSQRLNQKDDPTERECWASAIVDSGINQNIQDVRNILSHSRNLSWQELRYKILVPRQCLQQQITYPDYNISSYPKVKGWPKTIDGFKDHIYRSLKAGYPVEASFCAQLKGDGSCGYHSATIVGQRQICNMRKCSMQFRLQNSYGKSWQENFDNGWVDADNLSKLMMSHRDLGLNTITPVGVKLDENLKAPQYKTLPMNGISVQRSLWSQGKSSLATSERCWSMMPKNPGLKNVEQSIGKTIISIPPPTAQSPKAAPSISRPQQERDTFSPKKGVIYICKDEQGKTTFTDRPLLGMSCRER